MALIVETGEGVAEANSYDTSENANFYFHSRNLCTKITDGDMLAATEFLEATYGLYYRGDILNPDTQGLLFPRTSFINSFNKEVQAGTIPDELKVSQYHAAKLNSEGVVLITNPEPDSQLSSITQTVDTLSESKSFYSPVSRKETRFIGIYLSPILNSTSKNRVVLA